MSTGKFTVTMLATLIALTSVTTVYAYPDDHRDYRHEGPSRDYRDHPPHPKAHPKPPHPAAQQHYKRGGHLPKQYYQDRRYYVNDWRGHGLRQPPRGHRWVEVDGRYILVAVATGVITSILLHNHHH
jgi:Ni/Co efflux regulator RcnB